MSDSEEHTSNMKTCTKCNNEQPTSDFYNYQRKGKNYVSSYCKKCQNKKRVDLYEANYERKQFSIVDKMLPASRKVKFDKELKQGVKSRKKIAEEYGIPISNIYYYYKRFILPTLEA